jgi:hypothetical protein
MLKGWETGCKDSYSQQPAVFIKLALIRRGPQDGVLRISHEPLHPTERCEFIRSIIDIKIVLMHEHGPVLRPRYSPSRSTLSLYQQKEFFFWSRPTERCTPSIDHRIGLIPCWPERDPLTYYELQQRDVPTPDDVHWASDGAAEISTEAVQVLAAAAAPMKMAVG